MRFYHIKVACDERKHGKPYSMVTVCIAGMRVGFSWCSPLDQFSKHVGRLRSELYQLQPDRLIDCTVPTGLAGYELAEHCVNNDFGHRPRWAQGVYVEPVDYEKQAAQLVVDMAHRLGSQNLERTLGPVLWSQFSETWVPLADAGYAASDNVPYYAAERLPC